MWKFATALVASIATLTPVFADEPLPKGALGRLGSARFKMGGTVISAGFTDGGSCILTGTANGWIAKTDMATGKELSKLKLPRFKGGWMIFSADGATVVTVGADERIRIFEIATGRETCEPIRSVPGVNSIAWLKPNETFVAPALGEIRIFDVRGKLRASRKGAFSFPSRVACSSDGNWIAAVTYSGIIELWDAKSLARKRSFERFGQVNETRYRGNLAFSPDGKLLVQATSVNGQFPVWEVDSGKLLRAIGSLEDGWSGPHSVSFSSNRNCIVADGDLTMAFQVWDVNTGKRLHTVADTMLTPSIAVSPDGKKYAAYGGQRAFRLWNLEELRPLHDLVGHLEPIHQMAFLDDGKRLATLGLENQVIFWDTHSGKELSRFTPGSSMEALVKAPDGSSIRLLARSSSGVVTRNVAGDCQRTDLQTPLGQGPVVISPEGRWLATFKNGLSVFDLNSGASRPLPLLRSPLNVPSLSFTHNGEVLAALDGETLDAWNTRSGSLLFSFRLDQDISGQPSPWALSPDARLALFADSAGRLRAVESVSGCVRRRFTKPAEAGITSLAPSPDGRLVAVAIGNGTFRIDDLATGAESEMIRASDGPIRQIAFSPDGGILATAAGDTTALLWDVAQIRPRVPLVTSEPVSADFNAWWDDLAGDGESASRAVWSLTVHPKAAIRLIRSKLVDKPPAKSRPVSSLIRELDDDRFAIREKATRDLRSWGELARVELLQALSKSPSPEMSRRINALLEDRRHIVPPDCLRAARILEVLEHIGDAQARNTVAQMAKSADAWVAHEASRTLERMRK